MLIFFLSCNFDLDKDYDKEKTTEFIRQLLEEEKSLGNKSFIKSNCVLKQPVWNTKLSEPELKSYLREYLKIQDNDFLNFQMDLFYKFEITEELIPEKKIITNAKTTVAKQPSIENQYAYLDWLEKQDCKRGFFSISKPLFNESYDLAIIRFEEICGPLCGGGVIILYESKKGKWSKKKILDNWIR